MILTWIKNIFKPTCTCLTEDDRALRNANIIAQELVNILLADLSVDTLQSLIIQADQNRDKVGHSDYSSLAELYCSIMRSRREKMKSRLREWSP